MLFKINFFLLTAVVFTLVSNVINDLVVTGTPMPGLNYNWYKKMNRPRYELESPSSGLAYLERIQPQQPRLSASSRHHFDQSITPRYILPRQAAFSTNFKRTVRHSNNFSIQKPFRPSPLIHASSLNHFTKPLKNPPKFESDEEEYIRPSSYISPARKNMKFIRQSSNSYEVIPISDNSIYRNPPTTRNNAVQHTRPVSIPSSSGADFPEIPKFENDISFGFGDSLSAVENAANALSGNIKHKQNKFRPRPVSYQEDPPKYQKEPVYQKPVPVDQHDPVYHHDDEELVPEHFGPQPVDYEPEVGYDLPAAPPAFSSIQSLDHELSLEGQGCTGEDGRFYFGGQTWTLPDCGRGVCAKTLRGGWEVTHERCDSIMQNPQYTCVIDEALRSEFPECCPRPIQCNKK